MSGSDENLSGVGLTPKEILLEVRGDVKLMSKNVDILVSQNLDGRLKTVESWKDQLTGKIIIVSAAISLLAAAALQVAITYFAAVKP